jgi:hypothetical protein
MINGASIIDIICGGIVLGSITINMPILLIGVVVLWLLQKAFMSLVS